MEKNEEQEKQATAMREMLERNTDEIQNIQQRLRGFGDRLNSLNHNITENESSEKEEEPGDWRSYMLRIMELQGSYIRKIKNDLDEITTFL